MTARTFFGEIRRSAALLVVAAFCLISLSSANAADPAFRTDSSKDDKLPWYQLKPGEFPPEGSAHAISGELIALDHINRTGVLRPDRTDAQRRGDWDRPLSFSMLPYGAIMYHGAPAELRDIPIGTHLHGQFYVAEQTPEKPGKGKPRPATEAIFSRVLKFEDDFSYFIRLKRRWKIEGIDLEAGTIACQQVGEGIDKPAAKPTLFQMNPATRLWTARKAGNVGALSVGQQVLINLTVCTLKGPGRAVEIWADAESQTMATLHQAEVNRQFQKEHGLAGWIDEVDNDKGIVTVTLFGGFDPGQMKEFAPDDTVTAAVAEDSLRTWDQINDRKSGPLVEMKQVPPLPGSSGFRLRFKPVLLLEGFRPQRIIRVWPSKWKVDDLPREERLYQ